MYKTNSIMQCDRNWILKILKFHKCIHNNDNKDAKASREFWVAKALRGALLHCHKLERMINSVAFMRKNIKTLSKLHAVFLRRASRNNLWIYNETFCFQSKAKAQFKKIALSTSFPNSISKGHKHLNPLNNYEMIALWFDKASIVTEA